MSDCGSPNEHSPGALIPRPPTLPFISSGYCEINPIISLVAPKAPLSGLVPAETPKPPRSLNKPCCPRVPVLMDSLIRASSNWGPLEAPVSGLINGEGRVLLATWQGGWLLNRQQAPLSSRYVGTMCSPKSRSLLPSVLLRVTARPYSCPTVRPGTCDDARVDNGSGCTVARMEKNNRPGC